MAFVSLFVLIQIFFISRCKGTCTKDCFPTLKQGDTIEDIYNEFNIIKDVLAAVPETLLGLKYGDICVYPGDNLSPASVASSPAVALKCDKKYNYTLIMVDPEFPNLDPRKQFLHWFVDQIPNCDVKMGVTVNAYISPTPPPATGPHRYIFFVFKADYKAPSITIPILDRINFSTEDFAKTKGILQASNFFLSQSVLLG